MLLPDHETCVDFLNYEAIAKTVVELLKENRKQALTIGIHGDWGVGKTSVLTMVQSEIGEDKTVACLWFNGWTFEGFDDAKTVLIEATISELCRQKSTIGKVKEMSTKLIKRIDGWKIARHATGIAFTAMTGLPSPDLVGTVLQGIKQLAGSVKSMSPEDIEGKITELASFVKPGEENGIPEQIHQFREEFAKLLDEAKIDQLVVLIDDLDRCLPETAIATLEAIRLFLFVPKTAFVIGADEGMIEYAVRQHFPNLPLVSGPVPYVRNYLEKLIQVPFRIPALGMQEVRAYVTLLLVEALTGEDDPGFKTLLDKAKQSLNQPWLGSGISQADVRAVNEEKQKELDTAYLLAQQIGPILAEGTKGNPRQVKRFLNSMFIRLTIANARGFGQNVNQAVLAKLMLAEQFQQDYYDHLSNVVMLSEDGKVKDLQEWEKSVRDGTVPKKEKSPGSESAAEKWFEKEWVQRWLKINPALGEIDLRPYVFVARDKRILAAAGEASSLDDLIEKLTGSEIAVRSVEPQVKALGLPDAEQVFSGLRERVVRQGSFILQPPGYAGLKIVAKHHPRYQMELLQLLHSIDEKGLGFWVVTGWKEILTEPEAITLLQELLKRWATQEDNKELKRAAGKVLTALTKARH